MTSVRDAMHVGLISCGPEARLRKIAEMLIEHRVHAVVVVDTDGEALGVVADSDLLAGEWLATDEDSLASMRAMTAGELMTAPVVTIAAGNSVEEAATVLHRERISRLVVTDEGRAVGVVASSDLVVRLAGLPTERRVVTDVMSHGFLVCREGTTIAAAARTMKERRSRSLVVVAADGTAVGIVTGRDLLPALSGAVEESTVDSLMHSPFTIAPDATLREAADRMLDHEVHRLLVVAEGETMPLGLISTTDIVAEMAGPGQPWQG